jgi:[ribosomal protein S5]-alanine N-acetyltransferase
LSFRLPFRKQGIGPILRSQKTIVRPPNMDDFKAWVDLRKSSRAFLEPWEPEWQDDEFTRSAFRYRLHIYNKLSEEDRGQSLFIFDSSNLVLVGAININNMRRGVAQTATLGYWIGQDYARQGFMINTLHLVLPYCFDELKLHRVEAACLPDNQASIALLKKAGFEQEGYAKKYLKIAGSWEDHLLFARLTTRN